MILTIIFTIIAVCGAALAIGANIHLARQEKRYSQAHPHLEYPQPAHQEKEDSMFRTQQNSSAPKEES